MDPPDSDNTELPVPAPLRFRRSPYSSPQVTRKAGKGKISSLDDSAPSVVIDSSGVLPQRSGALLRPLKGRSSPTSQMVGLSKYGKVRNFLASPVPVRQRYSWNVGHGSILFDGLLKQVKELSPRTMREELTIGLEETSDIPRPHGILHEAVLKESPQLVRCLINMGVDAGVEDGSGASALHWICRFTDAPASAESLEILNLIFECKQINVNGRDAAGYTPLMYATDQCNEDFVKGLINNGADVNCRSNSGTYPILISVYHGTYNIAELLFQAGAKIDIAGEDGMSPLMLATKMDNLDVVVFLVKSGAVVEFSTKAGVAKDFARSPVVEQFLIDSAFYQNHHKEKKRRAYSKMVGMYAGSSEFSRIYSGKVENSSSNDLVIGKKAAVSGEATKKEESVKVFDSQNYPLDLDYFDHPILGSAAIGMCMCPGRNKPKKFHIWRRDLNTDLEAIKDSGANILITLVKNVELLSMGIMELFVRARQLGLETLHFPVPDKWIPDSMSEVVVLISKILVWVKQGKKIVVHCLSEDDGMQVLTNHGFMFLRDVEKHYDAESLCLKAESDLLFAAFEPETQSFRYAKSVNLILQQESGGEFAEFSKGNGDKRNHMSVVVTKDHDMWVRSRGKFEKVKAGDLIASKNERQDVEFQSVAENGLSAPNTEADYIGKFGIVDEKQARAFLNLFGYWIRKGSLSIAHGGSEIRAVHFHALNQEDVMFLEERFGASGFVKRRDYHVMDHVEPSKSGEHHNALYEEVLDNNVVLGTQNVHHVVYSVTNLLWVEYFYSHYQHKQLKLFPNWALRGNRDLVQDIFYGMGTDIVFSSSTLFRDQVVQLALHAGRSPHFYLHKKAGSIVGIDWEGRERVLRRDQWCVSYAKENEARTTLNLCRDARRKPAKGRTWCVTVPTGLIIVRRAIESQQTEEECVVEDASTPVVIGNCNGGKGRTGMVAVATLVALGMSVDEGIRLIRIRRPGMIKNPAQIVYLRLFEKRWEAEHPGVYRKSNDAAHQPLEKEIYDDLRHEKKQNHKTPKGIAIVTLKVLGVDDISKCTIGLVAVSGQPPRHQKPIQSEVGGTFRFVVSDISNWHCLIVVTLMEGGEERHVVVKGGSEKNKDGLWKWSREEFCCKMITESGDHSGLLRLSYNTELKDIKLKIKDK